MYKKLFSPLMVGSLKLPNRIIMGSMHTGLEEGLSYKKFGAYLRARAEGEAGLIITGGISPNFAGKGGPFAERLWHRGQVFKHRSMLQGLKGYDTKIVMQILHTGRYAYQPFSVAPSPIKAPINPFTPKKLSLHGIEQTIDDFVHTAVLARDAGYHGVEVMGSEGYLINQFLVTRTNKRQDQFGGSYKNRAEFPLAIIKKMRDKVGKDFLIIFRISLLDLVEDGSSIEDILWLANELEKVGVDIFNSGIGWHEARVPTIAGVVPDGAFSFASAKLKKHVTVPVIAVNRMNTPEAAEAVLQNNEADLVSLARPFLADPHFAKKARTGDAARINTCIACNQECLDKIFVGHKASCLVNPSAGREKTYQNLLSGKLKSQSRLAIVGGGPAGLAAALMALKKGFHVDLFERLPHLGGQFSLAQKIPGKGVYQKTVEYFSGEIAVLGGEIHLSTAPTPTQLVDGGYRHIILATGVKPREVGFDGANHPRVISYEELLSGKKIPGKKVGIIGGGGIAVDVACYLLFSHLESSTNLEEMRQNYYDEWGIDTEFAYPGGLIPKDQLKERPTPPHTIYMFKRSPGPFGARLGKTTGWIHRMLLKKYGVKQMSEVDYKAFGDQGLVIADKDQNISEFPLDTLVVCAGQISSRSLYDELKPLHPSIHIIGGAHKADELDAAHAIKEGEFLAASLKD